MDHDYFAPLRGRGTIFVGDGGICSDASMGGLRPDFRTIAVGLETVWIPEPGLACGFAAELDYNLAIGKNV